MCLGVAAIAYYPAIYVSRKGFVVPRIDNRAYRDCLWKPIAEYPNWRIPNKANTRIAVEEREQPDLPNCRRSPLTVSNANRSMYSCTTHIDTTPTIALWPQWESTMGPKRTERADQKGDANYQISAIVFFFFIFIIMFFFFEFTRLLCTWTVPNWTQRNGAVQNRGCLRQAP